MVVVHTSGTTGLPEAGPAAATTIDGSGRRVPGGDGHRARRPVLLGVAVLPHRRRGDGRHVLGMGVAIIPQDWFSVDNWRRAGRLGVTCALLVPTMIDMLLAEGALGDAEPGGAPVRGDADPSRHAAAPRCEVLPETRFRADLRADRGQPDHVPQPRGPRPRGRPSTRSACCRSAGAVRGRRAARRASRRRRHRRVRGPGAARVPGRRRRLAPNR